MLARFTPFLLSATLLLSAALTVSVEPVRGAVAPSLLRVGDYRSVASGAFTNPANWEVFVAGPSGTAIDGYYAPAASSPTSANGTITLRTGHTLTVSAALTLDEVLIETGATLEHSGTANLTVADAFGLAYDFIVQGTYRELSATAGLVPSPGANIVVDDTGTLRHSGNGGTVPVAIWSPTSLFLVDGITSATSFANGRLGQEFGRITWNNPSQTSSFAFGPVATESNAVTTVAAGDVTVVSTGATGALQLASATKLNPLVFNANYVQTGGSVFVNQSANGTRAVSLAGNFTQSGGTFTVNAATGAAATGLLQVGGELRLTTSILTITQSTRAGSVSVTGDVRIGPGSTLRSTGTGTATFNFSPGPLSTFSNQGSITGPILFNVNGGATVDFADQVLTGGGTFTLSDGSIGLFGAPGGITAVGAADQTQGNVRVGTVSPFQRTYSPLAYYLYTGTGPQVTGSGLPMEIGTASAMLNAGGLGIYQASSTGTVTLSRDTRVSGELILGNGLLVSSPSAKLTLSSSALLDSSTAGSPASYVQGVLVRDLDSTRVLYEFPVGDGGAYRPLAFRVTPTTAEITLEATANRAPAPFATALSKNNGGLATLLGDTYWAVAQTAGAGQAIVRLPYDPAMVGSPANLTVAGYNPVSGQWENLGLIVQDLTAQWVEAPYSAPYTLLTLGRSIVAPLPVELLRFTAVRSGSVVRLAWATASEKNSAFFAVERSLNGRDFTEIARQTAAGTSGQLLTYRATDSRPLTTLAYYRLRQLDRDGQTAFSNLVAVQGGKETAAPLMAYPNPATDFITVALSQSASTTATLRLLNALGQEVLRQTVDPVAAPFLDLRALPAGPYTLVVTVDGQSSLTHRIVKNTP